MFFCKNQIIIEILLKLIKKVEYLSSDLLYEPKHILRAFTVAPELQFYLSDPRGKIIQFFGRQSK